MPHLMVLLTSKTSKINRLSALRLFLLVGRIRSMSWFRIQQMRCNVFQSGTTSPTLAQVRLSSFSSRPSRAQRDKADLKMDLHHCRDHYWQFGGSSSALGKFSGKLAIIWNVSREVGQLGLSWIPTRAQLFAIPSPDKQVVKFGMALTGQSCSESQLRKPGSEITQPLDSQHLQL